MKHAKKQKKQKWYIQFKGNINPGNSPRRSSDFGLINCLIFFKVVIRNIGKELRKLNMRK